MRSFTLEADRWYAMQLWDGGESCYSPVRVRLVTPLKSGNQELQLDFFHAFYPEGVREKQYRLRILFRGANYLLAQCPEVEGRCVWIGELTKDRLKPHVHPEHARALELESDLEGYLNRFYKIQAD